MKRQLIGLLARTISIFIPVRKNHWVFGSDYGRMYREGSKYLIEYMLEKHPEVDCIFVTKSKRVYEELKNKNIPCQRNYSLQGILVLARADKIFYTQGRSDLDYAYTKKGRKHYYLVHGMPLKKAFKQVPVDFKLKYRRREKDSLLSYLNKKISHYLVCGYLTSDIEMVSACSEFLAQFMTMEFDTKTKVKVLGMPRNDALFDETRMKQEHWVDNLQNKFVVMYMPTHRAYGKGEVTPTPFIKRPDIQQWMLENDVVLLMKNHPNMIPKIKDISNTPCIKDITKLSLDPQVCIYHSDVLITDFSSVWMDYLLLRRPILFYIYDNFEQNDVGTYYDIRLNPPGHFCYTEDELFALIKLAKNQYNVMKPKEEIIHKYHKFVDGNSCERYYQELIKDC